MAGKKIGIVISCDGEKQFSQAVANAKKESASLKAELKNLSAEYDGNTNSMEYLQKKQDILTRQQGVYEKKLKESQSGLEKATDNYNKQCKKLDELEDELSQASKELEDMAKAGKEGTKEYEKQEKKIKDLSTAVEKQTLARQRESGAISDWNKKIYESEAELKKANKAVEQNAKYLDEAKTSTDKCAKSIDNYGEEVKDATKVTTTLGDKLKTAIVVKGVDVASNAMSAIGDKAKEAAEFVVDVGSSFESAMSEVAAISGATGDELSAMSEKAKELGSSTKFSASEAADAFKYMSLAGWSTSDMLSGIDGIMNLAAASGMELAAASDMVTDYLSAFGMQAEDSAYMADMLAYAQASSNTTAEQLGEAYKNCAANLNASGQDIETTTSLLEAMANQGLKGSEAGTALTAMMRDITAKMKDGKIAIGDTNVAVMDANGNYRDMTDILSDVEKATEGMGTAEKNTALQSTFTADSIKGLNLVLADGMENVSGYEEALRNSDGAAKRMSDTMNDNLKGDLTTMNSALEGLGIAAYDYIDGPVRGVVQGVTDVISGITEAIAPQKSAVDELVESVQTANDNLDKTLQNASKTIQNAELDAGSINTLGMQLISLNSVEEKSLSQKYQLKEIVKKLGESIPEIASAYNEEAGSVDLTDAAIQRLIESTKELVIAQAAQNAMQEVAAQLIEAKIALENAETVQSVAADKKSMYEEEKKLLIDLQDEYYKYEQAISSAADGEAVAKIEKNYTNAAEVERRYIEFWDKQLETGRATIEEYNEALENVGIEQLSNRLIKNENDCEKWNETCEDACRNVEELTAGVDEANQKVDEYEKVVKESEEALTKEKEALIANADSSAYAASEKDRLASSNRNASDSANENAKSIEGIGDAAEETSKELDALGRDLSGIADEEVKEELKKNAQEIVDAYDNMKTGLNNAIEDTVSIFEGFAEQTPITINEMITNLESNITEIAKWEENMTTLAGRIGSGMSQELYDKLVELGPEQTAAAVQTLVDAAEGKAEDFKRVSDLYDQKLNLQANADTLAQNTSAGKARAEAVAQGISEGTIDIENSSKGAAEIALEEFQKKEEEFRNSGTSAVKLYEESLLNGRIAIASAAGSLGRVAFNALNSYQNAFYNAGYNMSAGVASGIYGGQSRAINAASNMARQTLEAAKKELEIHSPSRKFRLEVGQNISESTAFGIDDKASLAGTSAAKMSSNVYKKATAWLAKYKKSHKVSLEDEQYFWQQIVKHTKDGTAACEKAISNLTKANNNLIGSTLNKSISNNFGVSWKKEEDSPFSDGNKSVGDYYSEYYSEAKKTLSNYKVLHDMSLEQEVEYWKKVKKNVLAGTDVWYDVTATIKDLEQDIVSRNEEMNNAIVDNGEKYIERQKILGDVSTKQELNFWKERINQVEKNSDAYYEILEKINDLEEDLVDEQKERLQSLASTQDKILSDYKTYYKVSAQAEVQYWDIARKQFKTGTQERIDADKKYFDALQEMYDQRKELDEDYAERSKEINEDLKDSVQELQDAYHDAVSSRKQDILSSMNLFEAWDASGYNADTLINNLKTQVEGLALWEQQLEKLKERGISTDLYDYLLNEGPDAAANIYSLANATDEQLAEYQKLFNQKNELAQSQALKDNEGLLKETNDNISQLQKDAQKELDALNEEYKNSLSELTSTITSDLKNLVSKAEQTGEDAVSGLIVGIDKKADSVDMYNSTTKVVKNVTSSLQVLEEEGSKIGSGMLENILSQLQDASKIDTAAQKAVESVKYAMEKAMTDEYSNLSYAGIAKLNSLLESEPQKNTVVNVDNSGMVSAMQGMVDQIQSIVEKI